MKKLWRRASGIIKDRNSLWMASLARKSKYRNANLEGAVIKATSHDDTTVDYKNAQRVFTWVRTSPAHLIIFLWALTRRVERTRDWNVALKSLILLHGVLCTKAPGTRRIGRLPFDLSGFEDGYSRNGPRRWARTQFVRAYFGFADLKSVVLAAELKEEAMGADNEGVQLTRVKRWQDLLDAVLQVRPQGKVMIDDVVILEAMDCMIIEVFEVYSKICDGIAKALMRVYKDEVIVGKDEATLALDVLQKANGQGKELADYFEMCKRIGLLHQTECPKIEEIPKEDFAELERIIKGDELSSSSSSLSSSSEKVDSEDRHNDKRGEKDVQARSKPWLKTVITDEWEVFDEDPGKWEVFDEDSKTENRNGNVGVMVDPFAASYNFPPVFQFNPFIDYGGKPSQLLIGLS